MCAEVALPKQKDAFSRTNLGCKLKKELVLNVLTQRKLDWK